MGDFNAKIGKYQNENENGNVGKYSTNVQKGKQHDSNFSTQPNSE